MRLAPSLTSSSFASAAALCAALAVAPRVAAEPPDVAQAQTLFTEGRAALEKGDSATACARFNASLALVKRASTLLNLAQCEEQRGLLTASAKHWRAGIAVLPLGDDRLAISRERAAAVEARLPHLRVTISPNAPSGARVEIDGADASIDLLAAAIAVDPGRHVVVLFVPGSADQRATVDVAEKESRTVNLVVALAPPPPTPSSSARTAGFVLLGVGLASGVMAGVTGGLLVSKNSAIQDACKLQGEVHVCTPAGRDLINGAGPLKVVNAIGWGAGLAGVGAGIALVVIGGKTPASVTPTAFPGGGGALVTGRF